MDRPYGGSLSKPSGGRPRPVRLLPVRAILAGLLTPAAWLLAGCGSGGDLISTVALPSEQSTAYDEVEGFDAGAAPDADRTVVKPELTAVQRDYLDALAGAGVHPSSDLQALSIGSYVCQARAAGQSDAAVWDSVAPMVRSDLAAARAAAPQAPAATGIDDAIGHYIAIATLKLC